MSTPQAYDRLQHLLGAGPPEWNGIDYVEIASSDQTQLRVHFLTTATVRGTLAASAPVTITGGETIGSVAVLPVDETTAWSADADGRPVLSLAVASPGDFSSYTLTIVSTALDPYFDAVSFSFKAGCPSDLDCAATSSACPPPESDSVPVNYLAKDFTSFTQALSDFSAQRYPSWVERSEADVGVMLMEALSALADELSYYQDRVAAEAALGTATQRVSLVRHARLVDYEPAPAIAATTQLQLDVAAGVTSITAGLRCSAPGADGQQIPFQVGDQQLLSSPSPYPVNPAWNAGLLPYWWDDSRQCLTAGSTRLWLLNHDHQLQPGQQLLIDTAGASPADPHVREVVAIAPLQPGAPAPVREILDPVFVVQVTQVSLAAPTTLDHDLSRTQLAGNLVPARQGVSATETFAVPGAPQAPGTNPVGPLAVRAGANSTPDDPRPAYLYTLAAAQIVWLPVPAPDSDTNASVDAAPLISLQSVQPDGTSRSWSWQRWLLGSAAQDTDFTLTPESYPPVGTASHVTWFDYGGAGVTIRFGDGTFGTTPVPGEVFTVTYLRGGGTQGNVPAGTITGVTPGQPQSADVLTCTNPFPVDGGADEETDQQIRDRAPQAFRARPLRVVQPGDYVAAAQSLPWVQQAGTTFRWTGSWLTVFTTADPAASEEPDVAQLQDLTDLLNRRRLAGYESYVLAPQYASLDLQIVVVADPAWFAADVEAAVLAQLQPGPRPDGTAGFFGHSRWAFGQPLESSALLAAVQRAPGVAGVAGVQFRERGVQPAWTALTETVSVEPDRILRVDNDPSRPEAGSLRVIVECGK
jgi:uncharacterized phage protein gp47/JayE